MQRIKVPADDDPLIDAIIESARYAPCIGQEDSGRQYPPLPLAAHGYTKPVPYYMDSVADVFPPMWGDYEKGIAKAVGTLLNSEIFLTTIGRRGQPYTMRIFLRKPEDFPECSLHIALVNKRYDAVIPRFEELTSGEKGANNRGAFEKVAKSRKARHTIAKTSAERCTIVVPQPNPSAASGNSMQKAVMIARSFSTPSNMADMGLEQPRMPTEIKVGKI